MTYYGSAQRELILVLGKPGTGKSFWTKNYLRAKSRYIVAEWDVHEYRGVVTSHPETLQKYLERYGHARFRICHDNPADLPYICAFAQELRDLYVVIEEADRPGLCGHPLDEELMEVVSRGRHYGVSLIAVTGRPTNLAPDIRSRANRVIIFNQTEPDVLTWISKYCGVDQSEVRNLLPLEYFDWRLGHGVSRKKSLRHHFGIDLDK